MDDRNNRSIPQNRQNYELTNAVPQALDRFVQEGVTPEQYAVNVRQLEEFSRRNAMALQVHLQRESQRAEQRRQEEFRLIQLAQQLASGNQQQHPLPLPPPAPQPPYHHYPVPPQQPIAPRNVPVSYNNANINNSVAQHWSYVNRARGTNVQHQPPPPPPPPPPQQQQQQQQQQHRPSVSASAPFGNQGMYSSREANLGSHQIGRAGVSAGSTSTPHISQFAQPPNAVRNFVHQTPQYSGHSGVPAPSSQTSSGHASASSRTANYDINHPYAKLNEQYASWVRAYGDMKAASMAEEYMQSWKRQMHPTTSMPHSTVTPPEVSMSAQNLQHSSPSQVSKPEVAVLPPPPIQTQEWSSFAPVASAHGQQTPSQHAPPAPPNHAPLPHTAANEFTPENNSVRPSRSTGDANNSAGAQSHHPEVTTSSRVVTSTDHVPTLAAPPSSQSDSTQSILLASEENGKALYSMRGLAASIKRSLNAERLAASMEPSTSSDPHSQKSKPLNSTEIIDSQHQTTSSTPDLAIGKSEEQGPDSKTGTRPVNLITEPDDSPETILPVSISEVSIPHEEIIRTANGFQIPNSQHVSSPNFTPYSTLTGAVSFNNITDSVPVSHNPAPSTETTGVLEDTTTSQPASQIVLHDDVEDPLIPDQLSFEPLSFPHRTPTPPLVATITIVDDEDEVDEKPERTPSSRPSTPLHEIEIDSQLQYLPSGNEDDVEMSSVPGEGDVPIHPNIASPKLSKGWDNDVEMSSVPGEDDVPIQPNTSSEFSNALDNDALMQKTGVSSDQVTPLGRPIGEIDRGSIGSPKVEEHPVNERRRSTEARVLPNTLPTRVQSTDSAETSSRGSLPKLSRKSQGKQIFYIAVPPASEWVLQAKRREAERRALMKEKAGQHNNREYAECELANRLCLRRCHWGGCQAVLNSMYALKQHVRQHQLEVKPVGPAMTVSCRWKQCRMVCERSSLLLHLDRHMDKGVTCIYDDCEERFSRIRDLVEHEKVEHANDEPPPSAIPQPPEVRSPVTLPQTVPSYTTTTRPTSKPSITADRHARLGPWTLGMIIGHPTAGPDFGGPNTALRIGRTARLTDKALNIAPTAMFADSGDNGETRPNCEFLKESAEYEILDEPSVASSRVFGELDTVGVTGEFYEGGGKRRMKVGTPLSGGTETDSVLVEGLL